MKNLSLIICLMISALFGSVGGVVASDLPACPEIVSYEMHCFRNYTPPWGGEYKGEWKLEPQTELVAVFLVLNLKKVMSVNSNKVKDMVMVFTRKIMEKK